MKRFFKWAPILVLLVVPVSVAGQVFPDNKPITNSAYLYTLLVPKDWVSFERTYTTFKGEQLNSVVVTQQTDISSRRTKYFFLRVGTPGAVFGLSPKVVQKLSQEQMVDFYIDNLSEGLIGFSVLKTEVKNEPTGKKFVVEYTAIEPGPYIIRGFDSFIFKNGNVYHRSVSYFSTHATYAGTLQSIADSLQIR